jgi:hypothetical protein
MYMFFGIYIFSCLLIRSGSKAMGECFCKMENFMNIYFKGNFLVRKKEILKVGGLKGIEMENEIGEGILKTSSDRDFYIILIILMTERKVWA